MNKIDCCKNINVVGDWIYYSAYSGMMMVGENIEKMKTDGSNRSMITDDTNLFINVVGDWIYYVNWDEDNKIYRIKTDGSGRCKLNDDDSENINVVGEWIYYDIYVDEQYKQYRIKTDGSDRSIIN